MFFVEEIKKRQKTAGETDTTIKNVETVLTDRRQVTRCRNVFDKKVSFMYKLHTFKHLKEDRRKEEKGGWRGTKKKTVTRR